MSQNMSFEDQMMALEEAKKKYLKPTRIQLESVANMSRDQLNNLSASNIEFNRVNIGSHGFEILAKSRILNSVRNRQSLENTRDRLRAKLALKQ